jgi:hypothetical protein
MTRETKAITKMQMDLEKFYLIFSNDFLSIAMFAEVYAIPSQLAQAMIDEGRLIHNGKGCLYESGSTILRSDYRVRKPKQR